MALLETVSHCEFLRAMPKALVARLDSLAKTRSYSAGTTLFAEGDAHPDFHIVAKGHVRLDMLVPQRGRIPILTAGTGDILAWSALIGNAVMTSTAVALEPVETLAFPGNQLRQLSETEHEVGFYVMRQLASAMSRRLLATRLQLLDLFADHVSALDLTPALGRPGDPEC